MAEKLSTVGEPPQLTHIKDSTKLPGFEPVSMPSPTPFPQSNPSPNSLWQVGSRSFFKDQRASRIGDIVTVMVEFDQQESFEMTPQLERKSQANLVMNNILGVERAVEQILPFKQRSKDQRTNDTPNPNWLNYQNNPKYGATSKYDVKDKMKFKIAAYVTQMLPNGNMVVEGRQEIRLVNEVREVMLKGIIRREDVGTSNTVTSDKIAELRISYSGRGDLSDLQSQPWGAEIINKVNPF